MAGAENIYRHDYEDVAASYVWVTVQDHLPALGFRETNVGLKPASLEYWLSKGPSQVPYASRAGEEIRKRWTLIPRSPGQRDLGKVSCAGHADLRVGGNQVPFRFPDIWPPLQQC